MQEARIAVLDGELADTERELSGMQTTLRADAASGEAIPAAAEAQLVALAAKQVAMRDERMLLAHRLDHPAPPAGPHDHLRHRREPIPPEERSRRRVLAVWAAVSTPLVLAWLILLVLPLGPSIFGLSIGALLVICTIEAIARGQLVRFLGALVVVVAVVAVVLVGLWALFIDWRISVSIALATAAVVLLVVNLAELRRD
jgi:hypothetical protein